MDFLIFKKRREEPEINLTPILDMLVSIIFFLLIFCVFNEYSQVSLPAVEETSSRDSETQRLAPKLLVHRQKDDRIAFDLIWTGNAPGRQTKVFSANELTSAQTWLTALRQFTEPFSQQHPLQKSIEIGMDGHFSYQHLLFVIDALADQFPDVALIDPKKIAKFGARH